MRAISPFVIFAVCCFVLRAQRIVAIVELRLLNNLTYLLKSTVCILHVLMHLTSSHVTFLAEEFHPQPKISPQSDLGHWVDSR